MFQRKLRDQSCCCSVTKLFLILGNPIDCSMPGSSVLYYLLEFAEIHINWFMSIHIQWCYLTISSLPPPSIALNLSQHQGVFQWVSSSHQVAKYWSFSFSVSASDECLELILFRIDRFDFLSFQGTLKNLLQHHKLKASVLSCWAFFVVQLSHGTWLLVKP